MSEADLLTSYTECVTTSEASALSDTVTVGEPMISGETYHCKIRVFDKKGDTEISSELDFKAK